MLNDKILNEITVLLKSHYAMINLETVDDERAHAICRQIADSFQIPLFIWTINKGLYRESFDAKIYQTEDIIKAFAHIYESKLEALYFFKGFKPFMEDNRVKAYLIGMIERLSKDLSTVIFTGNYQDFDDTLKHHIASVKLPLPTQQDYMTLLKQIYADLKNRIPIKIMLSKEDLKKLLFNLNGLTLFEAKKILTMMMVEDGALTREDIGKVIDSKKKLIQKEGVLEYYTAEENFLDIADLKGLKTWLRKRQQYMKDTQRAKSAGLNFPKGILLLGVPGTGKSLCAKAISTEWGLPLLRMDPARLYSKYIGETEQKFNRAMEISEKMSPLILWIDEIEKAFAGGGEADSGLSQRIIGSFLSWMQERQGDVFVIATANDVNSLPPEFLRKGRFDEIFFVDLPDEESRKAIIQIHLKRRKLSADTLNLDVLATLTEGFSGAEIEQVIVSALYTAFSNDETMTQGHIENEVKTTRPLSKTCEEQISALRHWAKDRTVSAN